MLGPLQNVGEHSGVVLNSRRGRKGEGDRRQERGESARYG